MLSAAVPVAVAAVAEAWLGVASAPDFLAAVGVGSGAAGVASAGVSREEQETMAKPAATVMNDWKIFMHHMLALFALLCKQKRCPTRANA